MNIEMPYDAATVSGEANVRLLNTIGIADVPALADVAGAVRHSLDTPLGLDQPLSQIVQPHERVVIIVSDATRRTGAEHILPPLLKYLVDAGINKTAIQFVFATGTHRPPNPDEQARILGHGVYEAFKTQCVVHNAHDTEAMMYLGETVRGTPVFVNQVVCNADRVIVIAATVLHYFAGFGGGRKSVVPGVAGVKTIAHNHALNLDPNEDRLRPEVRIGVMDGNPVAEDMAEATSFVKVDFLLNTVMNRQGEIASLFGGHLDAAHRASADFAEQVYKVPITEQADLVVAASPHTLNYVQTHKALFNAYQAMKPGGRIILVAPCREGLGGEQFVQWLRFGSPQNVIAALRRHSEINGQTALSTLQKGPSTTFVTQLTDSDVALLHADKAATFQEALDQALAKLPPAPTCYLMPAAAYTVPRCQS